MHKNSFALKLLVLFLLSQSVMSSLIRAEDSESPLKVTLAFMNATRQGDFEAVEETLADHFVHRSPMPGDQFTSAKEFMAFYRKTMTQLKAKFDYRLLESPIVSGNRVVLKYQSFVTGFTANTILELFTVSKGKLVAAEAFFLDFPQPISR